MATSTTSSAVTSISASPLASSTTLSTSVITEAPLPVLTTPYIFPTECGTPLYNISIDERTIVEGEFGSLNIETYLYIPKQLTSFSGLDYSLYQPASYAPCFRPPGATSPISALLYQDDESAVYRGAVCPSGWVALSVGLASEANKYHSVSSQTRSTWSSAYCCPSGHSLVPDIWRLGYEDGGINNIHACATTVSTQTDLWDGGGHDIVTAMPYRGSRRVNETYYITTGTKTYSYLGKSGPSGVETTPFPTTRTATWMKYFWHEEPTTETVYWMGGRMFYPPWSVEWVEEDNKTLDPAWPTLTSDMLIPTWQPGDTVPAGKYDNKGSSPATAAAATASIAPDSQLGKVGLPVVATLAALLGLLLLGGLLFWGLRRRRAKKTMEKEGDSDPLELGSLRGEEHGGRSTQTSNRSSVTQLG